MTTPFLSVVIPTYKRPQYLPRAIDSALHAAPDGDVEVIVVPNGPDESWKQSLARWKSDARVRVTPIATAHGNVARNHGMTLATGKYIRFLDDDDYLLPASIHQSETLDRTMADVSSGAVRIEDSRGRHMHIYEQPRADNFVIAAIGPGRRPHPSGHVYRRHCLHNVCWRENLMTRQDVAWLMDVAASQELSWVRLDAEVGVWMQHRGSRVSRGHDSGAAALKTEAEIVQTIHAKLESEGRMTPARNIACADALWSILQKGLRYEPRYWFKVARVTDGYVAGRRPPSRIHRLPLLRSIPPLAIETTLIPVRWAYDPLRRVLNRLGINRA